MPRALLALVIAALALTVVGVAPVDAGGIASSVTISATCNTTTGDYDVTFDLNNGAGVAGDITVLVYEIDGAAATAPVFSPDPVPATGSASATDTVPGTTTSIYVQVEMDFGEVGVQVEDTSTPDGDCVAPTTTTTTAATSSSVAPDVAATCAAIEQIQALDVGTAGEDDPDVVLAQLQTAIDSFEAAAAIAPPEVADDLQAIADGLSQIRSIVTEIVAQPGQQPTEEQQQQLASLEDSIGPAAMALEAWAEANCTSAQPAPVIAASPNFTG